MKILLMLLLGLYGLTAYGQKDFYFLKENKYQFKFETLGNLVVIPVKVNGVSLSFLLDTGVKETILFASKEDSIPLENQHQVTFSGIGIEDGVEGIMAIDNRIEIGGVIADSLHNLYVIDAADLDLSSHVGIPINGIIGSRLFENFQVKIDYIKSRISLYPFSENLNRSLRKYTLVPFSLERSRPYVEVEVDLSPTRKEMSKMLIDMGNSDGLLMFPFLLDTFTVHEPSIYDYIGKGFNGEIYGNRNRIPGFNWAGFEIKAPIVAYPDSNAVHAAKLAENRKGSIGNQVLQRFTVLFNYEQKAIYLKPNKDFNKPFPINMTGMEIKHDGMLWTQKKVPTSISLRDDKEFMGGIKINMTEDFRYEFQLKPIYIVSNVREGSPAFEAGVRKGDYLRKINGKEVSDMKLKDIMHKFHEKEGLELKLLLERGDEKISLKFNLKDPIPLRI